MVGMEFCYRELDFLFKRANRDLLQDAILSGVPYYIPKWLGGLGLDPGPRPDLQISHTQRVQASILLADWEEKQPKAVTNSITCLLHEKVQEQQLALLKEADISLADNSFLLLETEHGHKVDLIRENQRVYTVLAERAWKTMFCQDLKTDLEDEMLEVTPQVERLEVELSRSIVSKSEFQKALNEKRIKSRLRHNAKLWRSAFDQVLERRGAHALPWIKLWHRKQPKILPLILADAVRDQKDSRREILGL